MERFETLTRRYASLKIAVIGDFCLDRYFEIDPSLQEISIETGLPVHNVVNTRCQPGAAGTILNNLCALGLACVYPVGISGSDGEGFELRKALAAREGVALDYFITSPDRHTFTYSKPLLLHPGRPPQELRRLDLKNWQPTPDSLRRKLAEAIHDLTPKVDAMVLLDQVDLAETGVISPTILDAVGGAVKRHPQLVVLADSRRGLRGYPKVGFKMNRAELTRTTGLAGDAPISALLKSAADLAGRQENPVIITLAEDGLIGAAPGQGPVHVPALPLRGEIDIVGAGDSVMANLAAALASGGTVQEALELAALASSIVIHQLGTTGSAGIGQILELGRGVGLIMG